MPRPRLAVADSARAAVAAWLDVEVSPSKDVALRGSTGGRWLPVAAGGMGTTDVLARGARGGSTRMPSAAVPLADTACGLLLVEVAAGMPGRRAAPADVVAAAGATGEGGAGAAAPLLLRPACLVAGLGAGAWGAAAAAAEGAGPGAALSTLRRVEGCAWERRSAADTAAQWMAASKAEMPLKLSSWAVSGALHWNVICMHSSIGMPVILCSCRLNCSKPSAPGLTRRR
mmetsp:Transcript_34660/g.87721  ORF Transcript_34660/g.87721 Transcript_34660/m.87721 type:complete len:229 (+) Transcript_34660:2368-3054(+)